MTIEEIKAKKKELGWTNKELAAQAGVPLSTVAKILGGTTRNPHKDSQNAIETALLRGIATLKNNTFSASSLYMPQQATPEVLRDPAFLYGTAVRRDEEPASGQEDAFARNGRRFSKGGYTILDYLALPKDQRVELIDGHFYTMEAPSWLHQKILLHIWKTLDTCIETHDADCEAMAAPFDVQLFNDPFTVVQPDVMVFCHVTAAALQIRAHTAPDFVAEVLSPSTGFRDRTQKLCRYRDAGVKEVWIVDPARQTILAYCFYKGSDQADEYTFHDRVPLGISGRECVVDFSKVLKYTQTHTVS